MKIISYYNALIEEMTPQEFEARRNVMGDFLWHSIYKYDVLECQFIHADIKSAIIEYRETKELSSWITPELRKILEEDEKKVVKKNWIEMWKTFRKEKQKFRQPTFGHFATENFTNLNRIIHLALLD